MILLTHWLLLAYLWYLGSVYLLTSDQSYRIIMTNWSVIYWRRYATSLSREQGTISGRSQAADSGSCGRGVRAQGLRWGKRLRYCRGSRDGQRHNLPVLSEQRRNFPGHSTRELDCAGTARRAARSRCTH